MFVSTVVGLITAAVAAFAAICLAVVFYRQKQQKGLNF